MKQKIRGCFLTQGDRHRLPFVYRSEQINAIRTYVVLPEEPVFWEERNQKKDILTSCQVLFSTWGMPTPTREEVREFFPQLKVIFYAAGSVQSFARPFLEEGVEVVSAWRAMSAPVAQFTVSAIVFANKGAFLSARRYRSGAPYAMVHNLSTMTYPGTYRVKVGILGAGSIGRLVIQMLQSYPVEVLAYDPFLSQKELQELGATKAELDEIFSTCQTISNHIADTPATKGMLDYSLFSQMLPTAAFINTGRGAQVVEKDLAKALLEEPLRLGILDVTNPEPTPPDHPFQQMENVFLFPHVAGYGEQEVQLLSNSVVEQLVRYTQDKPLTQAVTLSMLETMA